MDHREQIVLQGALNALPRSVSIATYRFRHVADRLTERGLLTCVETTVQSAQYSITPAGRAKLQSLYARAKPSREISRLAAE